MRTLAEIVLALFLYSIGTTMVVSGLQIIYIGFQLLGKR
jgi:hypothetical protein